MAKSYDLKNVIFTVGGVPISGFADGDAVEISDLADVWEAAKGADGEYTRSKVNDEGGTITFNLKYTSDLNEYFNELLEADKNGKGVVAIQIIDRLGSTEVFAPACWIKSRPPIAFGRAAGDNVWVFECETIQIKYGSSRDSQIDA